MPALRLTLTPQERALIDRGGTSNAEAYDLYLRGQALLRDHTDSTLPQAADLFQQAIERDPDFAQAHAGLANAIAVKGQWQLGVSPAEFEAAIRASQRALDLEPQMPEAFLRRARACCRCRNGSRKPTGRSRRRWASTPRHTTPTTCTRGTNSVMAVPSTPRCCSRRPIACDPTNISRSACSKARCSDSAGSTNSTGSCS